MTGPGIWVLKGGTALEVRWRERARTTKDLDLALRQRPPEFQGMCVSQEYPTFDMNRERAEPAYIGWLCRWDAFWKSLLAQSKGLGARRDRVHPERLLATQIPLPTLEEQRRLTPIATTMDELDKATRSFDATFKALEPSIIGAAIDGRL
jgi:type I restriction enzyme S subunit